MEAIMAKSAKQAVIGYLVDGDDWTTLKSHVSKLTHVNYSFAGITDGKIDGSMLNRLGSLNELREINPELKILITIGGLISKTFSDVALTEEGRAVFAKSAAEYVRENRFDGIDIDWEYPGSDACGFIARAEDKHNFTLMLEKLREELDNIGREENRHYILSIAAGAGQSFVDRIEMGIAQQSLDFVNIMTYDYRSSFDKTSGHQTNLFPSSADTDTDPCSAENDVSIMLKAGVPAEKLLIGAAFYARGWANVANKNNGLYQPAESDKEYVYTFDELAERYIDKNGFTAYWDESAQAPYLFDGSTFISYDDEKSVRCKAQFVKDRGLAGIMFWQYCQNPSGKLINAIYETLRA